MNEPEFKQMIARTYTYEGEEYRIRDIKHIGGADYRVLTDKHDLIVKKECLITDFTLVKKAEVAVLSAETSILINRELDSMVGLTAILMNNIKKVETDPKYIDQARSINESAKQIIEVKKAQIEMVKLMKSI